MSDLKSFPPRRPQNRGDGDETWKEYMAYREEAGVSQMRALQDLTEGNPREACVHAILSVGSRLEALTYLISKQRKY